MFGSGVWFDHAVVWRFVLRWNIAVSVGTLAAFWRYGVKYRMRQHPAVVPTYSHGVIEGSRAANPGR